jgi:2-succinyl-6-hydroxy-2,4-cyclohexadiene-1-carboxylate synthase
MQSALTVKERRYRLNGLSYHVELAGEGPPLLLLHGFAGSAAIWRPFLPEWARSRRIAAVDLPGHGRTDVPRNPARCSMENVAADLCRLLDRLSIGRTAVLGYSMGGRLALSLAMLAPERVSALVVESGSPGIADAGERQARARQDGELAARIERDGIGAFVDHWENLPLFASAKRLPAPVRESLRQIRLANRPEGLAASLRGMGTGVQPSWWDRLPSLAVPVQLIAGELDEKFVRIAERMQALLPRARLAVVPDAGHLVHVEKPELFATIVRDFLDSTDKEA